MITRSTKQTKTRALQEITNVENETEKNSNKRMRVNDGNDNEVVKIQSRSTRRKTLNDDNNNVNNVNVNNTNNNDNNNHNHTGNNINEVEENQLDSHQQVQIAPSPKLPQSKSPYINKQLNIVHPHKECKDETYQDDSEALQPVELSNELNLSYEAFASQTSPPSSTTKKIYRKKLKRSDPTQCLEIISQIYDRYYLQEETFRIPPYIQHHVDINQKMRSILVDWLIEVHFKFRLQSPTLWLCINILDRFLSLKLIVRNRLQLLGVSSLLIACKFEEIFPPEIQDCVYITDRAYSKEEILTMEQLILQTLDYQLCIPTGFHFLTRYLNLINASEILRSLTFYYAERNLQEPSALIFKPSLFAAGALYAALCQQAETSAINNAISPGVGDVSTEERELPPLWPDILIEESAYDEKDVLHVAKVLMFHVSEEPVTTSMRRLVATKRKYSHDKYHRIAELELPRFTRCKAE